MAALDFSPVAWAFLAVAAALVGVSKTALPGINTLSIAIFAALLPAKSSTGALLLLLIVGDVFALLSYRRHADWHTLLRLIPAVVVGLALGALFLALADDGGVRRVIGVILLLIIAFTLWQRWRAASRAGSGSRSGSEAGSGTGAGSRTDSETSETSEKPGRRSGTLARIGYGSLGGFTTMVANAGGPVMSMYFLSAHFPVKAFLGTAAWFFAVINLAKVPISVGLGLITPSTLLLDLLLVPGVIVGAIVGRWIALRIDQRTFEWAVVVCTILGAVYLLL
ncbi:MAG: sulfite exporter TauE/SafE family protein [Leucobacter sp.]